MRRRRSHPGTLGSVMLFPLMLLFLLWVDARAALPVIDVSGFAAFHDETGLPEPWRPVHFPSIVTRTSYEVVADQRYGSVLRAESFGGAGGVIRSFDEGLSGYRLLRWAWKIDSVPAASAIGETAGDDFPVRLLVSFQNERSSAWYENNTLCYVWAAYEPVGSTAVNPKHDNVVTVVAASGSAGTGRWIEFSRDIVADYRRAFAREPGRIAAVMLMTDTDDTNSSARAWYGPISLHPAAEIGP